MWFRVNLMSGVFLIIRVIFGGDKREPEIRRCMQAVLPPVTNAFSNLSSVEWAEN